jgi:hypothetical protein
MTFVVSKHKVQSDILCAATNGATIGPVDRAEMRTSQRIVVPSRQIGRDYEPLQWMR